MSWYDYALPVIALNKYLYHRAFPDQPEVPAPTGFGLPKVDEGTPLPIVYGRCRIRSPVMVWSGNYFVPGETIDAGSFGTYVANHFSVDMLLILGVPFSGGRATLRALFAGDTPVVLATGTPGGAGGQSIPFDGGPIPPAVTDLSLSGVFYGGVSFQDVTDNVAAGSARTGFPAIDPTKVFADGVFFDSVLPLKTPSAKSAMTYSGLVSTVVPGYRSQIAVFAHVAIGDSPSMPGLAFEIDALSTGSLSGVGDGSWLAVLDEADPAAVIYDLLTAPWNKVALPASAVDRDSFDVASDTLFSESHGYSRVISQGADATEIIASILKQIDAVLYQEPTTGMIVLKLVRGGYDVAELDDINPSNTAEPSGDWFAVQGFAEQPNQVRLTYTERNDNYNNATVIAQNPSSIAVNGGRLRSISVDYPGCCNATLARKLVARELAAVSRPLVKVTVRVNRSFYAKRPGDVVTFTWPQLGVSGMVMRIARVNRGRPGASHITMDLIRDVFDVTVGAFPAP
jgi:hypothetical protein